MDAMRIDNSQIQEFKKCPRAYGYKYVEGLRKREEGADEHDRAYGSAMHKGLEVFYGTGGVEAAIQAFRDTYPVQLDPQDFAKTGTNGVELLRGYFTHWKEWDRGYRVVENERVVELELEPGVTFLVKRDKVLESVMDGQIYVMDHKTTGKGLDYKFWAGFELDSQVTANVAATIQTHGQCSGFWVDGISMGFRKKMYRGEPAGFHYALGRQLVNRNKEQVRDWKKDTLWWVDQIREAREMGYWGRAERSFPCGNCSFRQVCLAGGDEQVIEMFYEKHDPFEYLNEKESA